MICPKCGAMVSDELNTCDNCGYMFEETSVSPETDGSEYNINSNAPALTDAFEIPKKYVFLKKKVLSLILLIIAIIIIALTFYGAHFMSIAGKNINGMQSASSSFFGFSSGIDVNYYKNLGAAIYGFAYVLRGVGIALGTYVAMFIGKINK